MKEFTCAGCGETFIEGWTDTEARAEFAKDYPDVSFADAAIVCEDCYAELIGKNGSVH